MHLAHSMPKGLEMLTRSPHLLMRSETTSCMQVAHKTLHSDDIRHTQVGRLEPPLRCQALQRDAGERTAVKRAQKGQPSCHARLGAHASQVRACRHRVM